jgi:superfamily II DNA or RNA helicase
VGVDHGVVTDWSEYSDPVELLMRLDGLLQENAELRGEVSQLRADNARLRTRLSFDVGDLPGEVTLPSIPESVPMPRPVIGEGGLPWAEATSDTEVKVALFRTLFAGRQDVYATRWVSSRSGRTGWSPAEDNPFQKHKDDATRVFWPLTDQVIYDHLARPRPGKREVHLGVYPLLVGDTCRFVVCDFDGKDGSDWRVDAGAYLAACRNVGIPAYVEISRSGAGAHVWIFFTAPVPAVRARDLAMGVLRAAIDARGQLALSSYDRLFPAQDVLPTNAMGNARFGNLIALPLQGASRPDGTTLFCDPETWNPYPDQFAYLSRTRRLTPAEVDTHLARLGPLKAGPSATTVPLSPKPREKALGTAPAVVEAELGAMLSIVTDRLPSPLLAALKHTASFHNPEFYRKQSQRFSTWNTPRLIRCFDDTDPRRLRLPRGVCDEAAELIGAAGGTVTITQMTPEHPWITVEFTGELTHSQRDAVTAMTMHQTGVLVAPPGSGKTIMACALIAHHAQPTAVVVNRSELLTQWQQRLASFVRLDAGHVGTLGGGKDRRTHTIDVVMLQSLTHRDAPEGLLDGYGLVIVDECHAVGAPAAQAAIGKAAVARWIGLSATPYRADQMDPLITMQCGPIRHEIHDTSTFAKHLIVHPTRFTTDEPGNDGASIQAIYNELAHDHDRNAAIAADIADATRRGRCSLALTNRLEHLHQLDEALRPHGVEPLILHGGLPPAERGQIRAILGYEDAQPLVLLAIDKLAGEGFDAPKLDTLFLISPIAFKGRVIQQVGRIMRHTEQKNKHVEAHDYLDAEVPRLASMHRKRRRTLEMRGFTRTPVPRRAPPLPVPPHRPSAPAPQAAEPPPPTAESSSVSHIRAWARDQGFTVSPRGRLRSEIWNAWNATHTRSTE